MFSNETIRDIVGVAQTNGIEPAALLAVVEVESLGEPFEKDGVTPRFLFERHIFHNELSKRASGKLAIAVGQGLAHSGWRPKTQYKDQGTTKGKLDLLARARSVDEECANRSCSWGLGQVMGFNAESLGFANATTMVNQLATAGFAAQIDVMVRFLRSRRLIDPLNRHEWATVARGYNGEGFKKNRYDTKLAGAYGRWAAKVLVQGEMGPTGDSQPAPAGLAEGARGPEVETLQKNLKEAGYAVGAIDGIFGNLTRDAVLAFQADNQLATSGVADPATLQALAVAKPRPVNTEREKVDVDDLRKKGSEIIRLTDWLKRLAIGTGIIGGAGALSAPGEGVLSILRSLVGAPAGTTEAVPTIPSDGVTTVLNLAQSLIGTQGGLGLLTLGAAALLWRNAGQLAERRKVEHQAAVNLDK